MLEYLLVTFCLLVSSNASFYLIQIFNANAGGGIFDAVAVDAATTPDEAGNEIMPAT